MRSHLRSRWYAWQLGLCAVLGLCAATAFAQLAQTGAGGGVGAAIPSVCLGALDLSTGCVNAIAFGGLF
jgi:hypothetical protein